MQSPRKKLLLWLTALTLIMACAPSMATPVPISTLNANAISTYIVQTANVAATQTVAAIPTPIITITPRNTFTPEPTFTPIGTIIFPTSTPSNREQYFRVKHDSQIAEFHYQSRTAAPDWHMDIWGLQTPEVVPLSLGSKNASGTNRTTITGAWESYMNSLNDFSEKKLLYLKADNTALFNGNGFPQMESLTMGGNIITLDEMKNGWGRVHTMGYNDPGSVQGFNYKTRPDLVHKFVVVGWSRRSKATYWVNPPPGTIYWPLVSSRKVWIPMDHLESFPILPMVVTANKTQAIRGNPAIDSELTGGQFTEGASANVMEYYPSGSDVWGRLAGGGWVGLLIHEKGLIKYPTSWSMETLPPP